ncbi:MAG: coenzyme F420 hydrogenase, partial [Acidimicrobiia bacterium]|nr:coenzyme F420 hydrogenase [Acidimicrobiia bacterium]
MSPSPTERLNAIVEQGLCIGCGLCEALAPQSITVRKTTTGFEVPVVIGELHDTTVDLIYDVCPGTRIEGLPDRLVADDTVVDAVWGPVRRIVRAWAGNPDVRHIGSTGGVLTALAQFLVASGRVEFVLHVKASTTEPSFGEPTMSFTE